MGHTSMGEKLKIDEICTLVLRAKENEREAFETLIAKTQNDLYRFCLYLTGNRSDAEDICQDAYHKVLTKIKSLKEPTKFMSWLFQTAKNLFFDFLRSNRKESIPLETLNNSLPQAGGDNDLILHIHRALNTLDPKDRIVILLVDHQGYSYLEAAEIIGISEGALTSRIHRAREDFLKKFEGQ